MTNDSWRGPQITEAEAEELQRARDRMLARHKLIEGMIRNNEMQLKNESARGGADNPFDEATIIAKLDTATSGIFPDLACVLTDILKGKDAALRRPWSEAVLMMARGAAA